jgi:hypothetical protein
MNQYRVHQYPWYDLEGFIIDRRRVPNIPLYTYFTKVTYDLCLKHLAHGKIPDPNNIPNTILKFHELLFLFFTNYYKQQQIPHSWKTSLIILLYKKVILYN